jgi:nucleoside-diphosphate-sugar epimerase
VKRVVVLGAKGFLGAPIVNTLRRNGFEVITFSSNVQTDIRGVSYGVNLFDRSSLKNALLDSKPDVVISTAWVTEHGKFWTSELNTQYKDATLEFAKLSFDLGADAFLGIGSMSEYGNNPGRCDSRITPLVATDVYSNAKIETGLELLKIGKSFSKKTNWLRVFQAFGPNEKPERFIPGLISTLQDGKQFSIRTPNFEMDWTHTSDIASVVNFSISNELDHFVDVGTGHGTTVRNLSEMICLELSLDPELLDYSGEIPGLEKRAIASLESQIFAAGWRPDESLRDRIKSLL